MQKRSFNMTQILQSEPVLPIILNGVVKSNNLPEFIKLKNNLQNTASEFHVSKNGSDLNTGSLEYPFLTIQKAIDYAEENIESSPNGYLIKIHPGFYSESVTLNRAEAHLCSGFERFKPRGRDRRFASPTDTFVPARSFPPSAWIACGEVDILKGLYQSKPDNAVTFFRSVIIGRPTYTYNDVTLFYSINSITANSCSSTFFISTLITTTPIVAIAQNIYVRYVRQVTMDGIIILSS